MTQWFFNCLAQRVLKTQLFFTGILLPYLYLMSEMFLDHTKKHCFTGNFWMFDMKSCDFNQDIGQVLTISLFVQSVFKFKRFSNLHWDPYSTCSWGGPTTTAHNWHHHLQSWLMRFSSTTATSMTELLPTCVGWQSMVFGPILSSRPCRFTPSFCSLKAWGLRGMFFTSQCWMHWRQLSL